MKYVSASIKKYGNGNRYRAYASYYEEGKRIRKSKIITAKNKTEAKKKLSAWVMELEKEAKAETVKRPGNPHQTVTEYVTRYIDAKHGTIERSTESTYRLSLSNVITPGIGNVPIDELTPDDVAAWVQECSKRYSAATVKRALTLLRSAMTQAVNRDVLEKNPTRTVKPPKGERKKPNALTEREQAQLLAIMDDTDLTPFLLGVKIALYTGMREGEICALKWSDIDFRKSTITVERSLGNDDGEYYEKDTKTDKVRIIGLAATLANDLIARKIEQQSECRSIGKLFSDDLYVLGGGDGSFIRPKLLYYKWRHLANSFGFKGTQKRPVSFHDLRHTYATNAINEGIDIKTVSCALGHSNAAMTLNIYASDNPDAQRRATQTIEDALSSRLSKHRRGNVIDFRKTGTDD